MMSEAFQRYQLTNAITAGTHIVDLTPYINYIAVDSAGTADGYYSSTSIYNCVPNNICLVMHNGSKIFYNATVAFGGVGTTNAIWFYFDPNGTPDTVATSSGRSVLFFLYSNGNIRSIRTILPNTTDSNGTLYNPSGVADPPWFSWN